MGALRQENARLKRRIEAKGMIVKENEKETLDNIVSVQKTLPHTTPWE